MSARTAILLTTLMFCFGCQSKQKDAKELPMDVYVKAYVTALREDHLMKQFQRPEAFPDSSLDRVLRTLGVNAGDFKFTQDAVNKDPMRKNALDSLIRQAIEAETLKSLNEKETEKN
jgi:hypothetical protein